MKELIKLTVESLLNNSDDWSFPEHTAENKKKGISIWTSNGILMYKYYKPFSLSIGLMDKFKLHIAIEHCKKNILINRFNEGIQE